jgi:hypothetical protein
LSLFWTDPTGPVQNEKTEGLPLSALIEAGPLGTGRMFLHQVHPVLDGEGQIVSSLASLKRGQVSLIRIGWDIAKTIIVTHFTQEVFLAAMSRNKKTQPFGVLLLSVRQEQSMYS